jgi:hypothetical protein
MEANPHLSGKPYLCPGHPTPNALALEIMMGEGPRPGCIVITLGFPRRYKGIQGTAGDQKEHFDVLINIMVVALRNKLGKHDPMTSLTGGARPIAHKLDECLLL